MATPPKQNYVQFLSQANLEAQQKLVKGYYQQLIRMYGITVNYFRKDFQFFDPDGLLNKEGNVDWTYGYDSEYTYGNTTEMIGYIEMGNDAFIFSMVGADAEQDGKIFFTKEQFELDMLDAVGVVTSGAYASDFDLEFENFYAEYDDTSDFGPFDLTINGDITVSGGPEIDTNRTLIVTEINTIINDDISGNKAYVNNWLVQGEINGHITGTLDENGDGTLHMVNTGDLTYNEPASPTATNGWGIAPQVDDFIRITYGDGTTEDYIFTQVTDRDLQNDGISPFLGKFVWKCQFTRRDYSHEAVPSGSIASEEFENDYLDQIINVNDEISDEIYDYDVEKDGADDDVYGGF